MNRPLVAILTTAVTLGLTAACEREEETARQELSSAAQEDPGFATDSPAAVVPVPDTAGGRTLTGNLAEMNRSGASGVITLTPDNGRTRIQLSVTGVQPELQLQPTIHRGGCGVDGELAHALTPIQADAGGAALEDVFHDAPVETVADGRHSVRVYTAAGYPQTPPIACAEIPTTAAETRI